MSKEAGDFIRRVAKKAAEEAAKQFSNITPQSNKQIEIAKIDTGKQQIELPNGQKKNATITGRAPAVGLAFQGSKDLYVQRNADFVQMNIDGEGRSFGRLLVQKLQPPPPTFTEFMKR